MQDRYKTMHFFVDELIYYNGYINSLFDDDFFKCIEIYNNEKFNDILKILKIFFKQNNNDVNIYDFDDIDFYEHGTMIINVQKAPFGYKIKELCDIIAIDNTFITIENIKKQYLYIIKDDLSSKVKGMLNIKHFFLMIGYYDKNEDIFIKKIIYINKKKGYTYLILVDVEFDDNNALNTSEKNIFRCSLGSFFEDDVKKYVIYDNNNYQLFLFEILEIGLFKTNSSKVNFKNIFNKYCDIIQCNKLNSE